MDFIVFQLCQDRVKHVCFSVRCKHLIASDVVAYAFLIRLMPSSWCRSCSALSCYTLSTSCQQICAVSSLLEELGSFLSFLTSCSVLACDSSCYLSVEFAWVGRRLDDSLHLDRHTSHL